MPVVLLHKYYLFVLIFTITKTHDDDDDDDDDHDKIARYVFLVIKYAFIMRLMDM